MRITVIHNPAAGRRHGRHRAVLEALREAGAEVASMTTTAPGEAEAIAAGLRPGACDRLVAAGGDGTINEVVNGLALLPDPPPLAVIPLGTANVLAQEIGLPLAPRDLARTVMNGPVHTVSLGVVNGRRFLLMAGVGFDAAAVASVSPALKRRLGKVAYVLASACRIAAGRFRDYAIVADGRSYRAASAVAALSRHYGGQWIMARDAGLRSSTLRLCLFERTGRIAALRYALALLRGRLDAEPGFRTIPAFSIAIADGAGEPIQADGDIVARLPATISILPAALRLVFPATEN